jgi:hypothetical protein
MEPTRRDYVKIAVSAGLFGLAGAWKVASDQFEFDNSDGSGSSGSSDNRSLSEREEWDHSMAEAEMEGLKQDLERFDNRLYDNSKNPPVFASLNRYSSIDREELTVQSREVTENLNGEMSPEEAVHEAENLGDLYQQIDDRMELPLLLDREAEVNIVDIGGNLPETGSEYVRRYIQNEIPQDIDLSVESRDVALGDNVEQTINDEINQYRSGIDYGEIDSVFQIYMIDSELETELGLVDAPDREIDGITALEEAYAIVELPNADDKGSTVENEGKETDKTMVTAALRTLGSNVLDLPHCYEADDCAMMVEPGAEALNYGDHCQLRKQNYLNTKISYTETEEDGEKAVQIRFEPGQQPEEVARQDIDSHIRNYIEEKHDVEMENWELEEWTPGEEYVDVMTYRRPFETQPDLRFELNIGDYVNTMEILE